MKRKTLSKILKTLVFAVGVATITAATSAEETQCAIINYTEEDLINNQKFLEELEQIEEEIPTFTNHELYEYLKKILDKDTITQNDLLKIKELRIDNLLDSNLSDLKYLTNLENLTIVNLGHIDLEDLKYNLSLTNLAINKTTITNTNYIPNGVNDLYLYEVEITDANFVLPYYLTEVRIYKTNFTNLTLKTPHYLNKFVLQGDAFLDLTVFKDCTNLRELGLAHCSNIKNAYILNEIKCIDTIRIDDYAAIWLTQDIFDKANANDYKTSDTDEIREEIIYLDKLANTLVPDLNISDEEKIRIITLYVIRKLNYDSDVSLELDNHEEKTTEYNAKPIYHALYSDNVICANYAALFQALANRVGLDTYQLFSDNHTWNMVNINGTYQCVDTTFLDSEVVAYKGVGRILSNTKDDTTESLIATNREEELQYYGFDLNDFEIVSSQSHLATHLPVENILKELNMGYVGKDNINVIITYKNKSYILNIKEFTTKLFFVMLLALNIISIKYLAKDIFKKEEIIENSPTLTLKKDQ